jgi:ribosomal protein S18 acetylase RimI-like enzyme
MPSVDGFALRLLTHADLPDYKLLRDRTLAAYPQAFTSDAEAESRRDAANYASRLGDALPPGGRFTLGAWRGPALVGAISCEREIRVKVAHIGQIVGMMVAAEAQGTGVGRSLLEACIVMARQTGGVEMLTLSVTAGNTAATRLYERAGFTRYGSLPRSIRVGGAYHAKDLMVLAW